jgi:hypothetical protein
MAATMAIKVIYLVRGKRADGKTASTLSEAAKDVQFYKRRGFTAWVEQNGKFVPVPGAKRQPKSSD